jgi:nucleoid-associated protein YgaU
MALYTKLAAQYTIQQMPGLSVLGLGIASSTTSPLGLQPPNLYTAWNELINQGVLSAAIWCLEYSAENEYLIEKTLISGASPTPGGVTPPISVQTGITYTYTVVSGDTFFSIAQKFYGDGNKYTLIEQANHGVDPNNLQIGQVLNIPAAT